MKSETDLRMSYVEFSWEYDFPEFIEKILEDDYITRPECYDEASLKRIAALLLLDPEPEVGLLLSLAVTSKKPIGS